MLIIKVYVNDDMIDEMTALNIEGPLNGMCTYKIKSKLYGDLGTVDHWRSDMAHKLIGIMCETADKKRNQCYCPICELQIERTSVVTVDDNQTYHSDCYYKKKMEEEY